MKMQMFFGGDDESPKVPDDWPAHLKKLESVATLALKGMPKAKLRRLSTRERAQNDDLLKMMRLWPMNGRQPRSISRCSKRRADKMLDLRQTRNSTRQEKSVNASAGSV
jgi:hypothetical protein